jgi:UDP-N-acetylglucosamine acyltransferase
MPSKIAATAWVDPRAELADDVEVGPFCVVGPDVTVGAGTRLVSQVTLMGHVSLGAGNILYPGAVVGGEPQDVSYQGSDTRVVIGDENILREGVTINRATEKEGGVTQVGSRNFLMAGVHVAHDCRLGDDITIANATLLGGHVHIQDRASLSGGVAVHHYTTIGAFSFVGGLSRVLHDVPPYMLCEGAPARPRCINIVALRRNRFTPFAIDALAEAHRLLYRSKVGLAAAREVLRGKEQLCPEVEKLLAFIETQQEGRHGRGRELRRAA